MQNRSMRLVQKIDGKPKTFKGVAERLFCKAMSEKGYLVAG